MTNPLLIRDAKDDDALDVIELIGSVFGEYAGCVLDVDGEMPELRQVSSYYTERGGAFWVASDSTRIVGCAGYTPATGPEVGVELKKLYVHRRARETGLGGIFVERVERAATEMGARFIELWSDTRFVTAHRFYEKRGYVRGETTRELHDKSDTVEYYFRKPLLVSPRP
jgi:putative acetyltransferase